MSPIDWFRDEARRHLLAAVAVVAVWAAAGGVLCAQSGSGVRRPPAGKTSAPTGAVALRRLPPVNPSQPVRLPPVGPPQAVRLPPVDPPREGRLPRVAASPTRSLSAAGESAPVAPQAKRLHSAEAAPPPEADTPVRFPDLPPDPRQDQLPPLPPLEQELWHHGGSYLYQPEGDRLGLQGPQVVPFDYLRLPPGFIKPRPVELGAEFLGADPVRPSPWKWFGATGYHWEPRFVAYGTYRLLGIAWESNDRRQDLLGHQLLLETDLRLTGTERLHVQFVPLGTKASGGSYYQFSDPEGYVDNATAVPDRYWFEMELESVLGHWWRGTPVPKDINVAFGMVPLLLHNALLVNDDMLGVVVSKNTLVAEPWSNLNLMGFAFLDDVDGQPGLSADLYGLHASMDLRGHFLEVSYLYSNPRRVRGRDAQFLAASYTRFWGLWTAAVRVMHKGGDRAGRGPGQLYALELLRKHRFAGGWLPAAGIKSCVWYGTAFRSTGGWNSAASGTFNRLTISFELDPLVSIAASPAPQDSYGVALGVQLFGDDENWALVPEVAWQRPQGNDVLGGSLTWWLKTGRRTYFQLQGIYTDGEGSLFDRRGVLGTFFIVF